MHDRASSAPAFYVDGASNDPTGLLIPRDPKRYTPLANPSAEALRCWQNWAQHRIGRAAMHELEQCGLVVVPRATWERAMALLGVSEG